MYIHTYVKKALSLTFNRLILSLSCLPKMYMKLYTKSKKLGQYRSYHS